MGRPPERVDAARGVAVPRAERRQVVVAEEQDPVVGEMQAQVPGRMAGGDDGDRARVAEAQFLPVRDPSRDLPRGEGEFPGEQIPVEGVPLVPEHAVPCEQRLERFEGRGVRGRGPDRRVRQAGQEREVVLMVVGHHDRRDPARSAQPFDLRRIGAGVHEDAAPVRHVQGVRVRVPPVLPALDDPDPVRQPRDHLRHALSPAAVSGIPWQPRRSEGVSCART